jgi:alanine racemase
MRATQAHVNLENLKWNIELLKKHTGRKLCAPVKADAYGHGAVPVARAALEAGAACLGVATVDEGAELRNAGITCPILLFSVPSDGEYELLVQNRLSPFVVSLQHVEKLANAAESLPPGEELDVHLKIDTGMGRIGCRPEDAMEVAAAIAAAPHLCHAGTCTHLAVSDGAGAADRDYTALQISRFNAALSALRSTGLQPGIVHAANSGAVLLHPEAWFDMVRPGIALYGYPPDPACDGILPLKPVMRLVSAVSFVKKVAAGESVSYGCTWKAPHDTWIATIPAGYGDGLPRLLSNKLIVKINGKEYPQRGRICMDQFMAEVDATVKPGDQVSVWDNAADIAAAIGTISYEITCDVNKRVPRVYQ